MSASPDPRRGGLSTRHGSNIYKNTREKTIRREARNSQACATVLSGFGLQLILLTLETRGLVGFVSDSFLSGLLRFCLLQRSPEGAKFDTTTALLCFGFEYSIVIARGFCYLLYSEIGRLMYRLSS